MSRIPGRGLSAFRAVIRVRGAGFCCQMKTAVCHMLFIHGQGIFDLKREAVCLFLQVNVRRRDSHFNRAVRSRIVSQVRFPFFKNHIDIRSSGLVHFDMFGVHRDDIMRLFLKSFQDFIVLQDMTSVPENIVSESHDFNRLLRRVLSRFFSSSEQHLYSFYAYQYIFFQLSFLSANESVAVDRYHFRRFYIDGQNGIGKIRKTLRIVADKELIGIRLIISGRFPVQQILFFQQSGQCLRSFIRRVDQRNSVADQSVDLTPEKRIMRASQNQRIDVFPEDFLQIAHDDFIGDRIMRPSFFNERNQKRAGFPDNRNLRVNPVDLAGIGSGSDGCLGCNDPDALIFRCLDRHQGPRLYHAQHRHSGLVAYFIESHGGSSVAGNDDCLDILCLQETHDLFRITDHRCLRFISVRNPCRVSEVNDFFVGKIPHNLPCDGQASESRVKYSDRCTCIISHYLSP